MTNPNDLAVTPHPDFQRNTILIEKFGMPLSKREHFAATILQGMWANHSIIDTFSPAAIELVAEKAVAAADALITSLNKTNK